MADLRSVGIQVQEIDLTTVAPAESATIAGYAGRFNWGPIGVPELVTGEDNLGARFGFPKAIFSATNAEANGIATSFMTASSFLAYASALRVSRVANLNDSVETNNAINAVSTLTVGDVASPILIKNLDDYESKDLLENLGSNFVIAKYAGVLGNSIGVSAAFTSEQYTSSELFSEILVTLDKETKKVTLPDGSGQNLNDYFNVGDIITFTYGSTVYKNRVAVVSASELTLNSIGSQLPTLPAGSTTATVTAIHKVWQYASLFNGAPANNEFHVVVFDATGYISGEVGTVLEAFDYLSNNISATNVDGTSAFYKTVLNNLSAWVWAGGADITSALASEDVIAYKEVLSGGRNGTQPTEDDYITAYAVFEDPEVDVSLLIAPPASDNISTNVVASYLIQNIAEVRKDLVVYLSPRYSDVVNTPNNEIANIVEYRNSLPSSSYGFMDSGWKYMLDRYNNTFRWVPLCGDVAGTAARTDDERDSWWSHGGFTRGNIKNVVRLSWNPSKQAQRDDLYQKGVNPVVTFNGAGTVLFGDKTLLDRPSAFDRINVRRLFIVLEKTISRAARNSLFEFNDEFTRARFVALVEPFLRDVQARRGITAFKVVCDTSNNTAQVIDTNRFIGDVYVKANRSINFITLRFVNTPTGVSFEEVVGQF